jgi:hypothetical protein
VNPLGVMSKFAIRRDLAMANRSIVSARQSLLRDDYASYNRKVEEARRHLLRAMIGQETP